MVHGHLVTVSWVTFGIVGTALELTIKALT